MMHTAMMAAQTASRKARGVWLLATLLVCVDQCLGSCVFPEFLQARSGDLRREWHMNIKEDKGVRKRAMDSSDITAYPIVIVFSGRSMTATVMGVMDSYRRPRSYSRECVLEIMDGVYLATHNEEGASLQKYLCMQFVRRSDDVVQIKASRMNDVQDPRLCSGSRLRMNEWPLINKPNAYRSSTSCPLTGGFNVKVYDKQEGKGYCDAFNGNTRMESQCMKGEGMHFRFRKRECIPSGLHMREDQQVYCMGSWTEGKYTFTVLRHDRAKHFWCFRYPTNHGETFLGYLFRDVHCDRAVFPSNDNYIRFEVSRDKVWPMASLCADDYEACGYWGDPCEHEGALTCPKRCGVCSDSRPTLCTIPPNIRGEWLQKEYNGSDIVEIDDMHLSIYKNANYRCVQWENTGDFAGAEFLERMFVTTFDNGCRPRYTCAQFKKRAPSILRYKLSQSQIWPFKLVQSSTIDCTSFKYHDDDEPFGDLYRSKHFKVVISESERVYVDCRLEGTMEFDVTFDDGVQCPGFLTQDGLEGRKVMRRILRRCQDKPRNLDFSCMDSTKHGYISDQTIVTETMDESSSLRCWLFPVYPERTFYLLSVEDCNEGATEKIASGIIKPYATFKVKPPTTTAGQAPWYSTASSPAPHVAGIYVDGVVPMTSEQNGADRSANSEPRYGSNESGVSDFDEHGGDNTEYKMVVSSQKRADGAESAADKGEEYRQLADDAGAASQLVINRTFLLALSVVSSFFSFTLWLP